MYSFNFLSMYRQCLIEVLNLVVLSFPDTVKLCEGYVNKYDIYLGKIKWFLFQELG